MQTEIQGIRFPLALERMYTNEGASIHDYELEFFKMHRSCHFTTPLDLKWHLNCINNKALD